MTICRRIYTRKYDGFLAGGLLMESYTLKNVNKPSTILRHGVFILQRVYTPFPWIVVQAEVRE